MPGKDARLTPKIANFHTHTISTDCLGGSDLNIDLFRSIGDGDDIAFRQVFRYYTPRLYSFTLRIVKSDTVAEGLVQQAFLKLWEQRAQVALKENPSSWLFTVAANLSFNYLKKMSHQQRYIEHVKRRLADPGDVPDAELILSLKDKKGMLYQAIDKMPPQRQYIFKLSRLSGLTHKEIGEKLQISPMTVKNQLVAALHFLRNQLRKDDLVALLPLVLLPF